MDVPPNPSPHSPLRVLQVCARFDPFTGGTETHVREVSSRLTSNGTYVTILTTDPTHELPRMSTVRDVEVRRVPAWPKGKDYHWSPGIWDMIHRESWDVVHVQGYHTLVAPLAMLAALTSKTPYVVSFHSGGHSSLLRSRVRGFQQQALGPLLRRASALVAVSRFEAEAFSQKLNLPLSRFVHIPNGASLPHINAAPLQFPGRTPLIVSVGRAEKYKGHHRMIEAMPLLRQKLPDAYLRIAGSGPYARDLIELAEMLGVSDAVTVEAIPPHDREGMARLLSSASLVVLLSEYEAHPVALMEALSLGRKVLAADTSGLSELSEVPLVRTIPLASTPQEICTEILQHLETPAPSTPMDLPTWDDCAASLDSLYRHIAGSQDARRGRRSMHAGLTFRQASGQ